MLKKNHEIIKKEVEKAKIDAFLLEQIIKPSAVLFDPN